MALFNQSHLPAIFSPRKVILKISLIPEDDLPRMAKSLHLDYLLCAYCTLYSTFPRLECFRFELLVAKYNYPRLSTQ
jgi:hypothetical protein